jgi:trigger factor
MKVEVEDLPNCLASLRIELPPDRVTKEWKEVVKEFCQAASIPGFRPGKAPANVVEAKFRKEIQEELTEKLVSKTTREAIHEKGLKVLSISEIDDVEITPEKSMRFAATLITAPEFELPDYKAIPVEVPSSEVTDEEVKSKIKDLRENHATFSDIEGRSLEMGDFAVIDYETTLDGKPVLEAEPKIPHRLGSGKDFWIKADEDTFLKGFSNHLVGLWVGNTREFDLVVAENYPVAELVSKVLHFKVTLKGVKSMRLPELNDEFASQVVEGFTVEKLHEALEKVLGIEKTQRIEMLKQNQIIDYLVSRVECELPQRYVKDETHRIISKIVEENQQRGIREDVLRENEKNIINTASRSAKDRLKADFILLRIATKEGIEVNPDELKEHIQLLASRYQVTFEKMLSNLKEKQALPQVHEEVLIGKVLDFLTSNANVETSLEKAAGS